MKHYRIIEKRKNGTKQYIIQHHNRLIVGLYFWQNLNTKVYSKYDDAINGVKEVINEKDYESGDTTYHYIDAYKLLKNKKANKSKNSIK